MIYLVLVAAGLLVGLVVGRWWALAAPAALGCWIALDSEVEAVPAWFLGLGYAGFAAFAVALGVVLRRSIFRA